jgi:hypothetical protein
MARLLPALEWIATRQAAQVVAASLRLLVEASLRSLVEASLRSPVAHRGARTQYGLR